jgi:hypothetical protein
MSGNGNMAGGGKLKPQFNGATIPLLPSFRVLLRSVLIVTRWL